MSIINLPGLSGYPLVRLALVAAAFLALVALSCLYSFLIDGRGAILASLSGMAAGHYVTRLLSFDPIEAERRHWF